MFERVTGGMSRVVGALWVADAGMEVCGRRPVRTIGGWRRVEIASESGLTLEIQYVKVYKHTILREIPYSGISPV
jgi:hypothetical protein